MKDSNGKDMATARLFDDRVEERETGTTRLGIATIIVVVSCTCVAIGMFQASPQYSIMLACIASLIVASSIVNHDRSTRFYFDDANDVLISRTGRRWHLTAGFRAVQVPTGVKGNPHGLLRALDIGDATLRVIMTNNILDVSRARSVSSWFPVSGGMDETLPDKFSGHAWVVVIERDIGTFSSLAGAIKEMVDLKTRVRKTLATYMAHHGFAPLGPEDLARLEAT